MPIWKLEPRAARSDPRWLDHEVFEEVLVRAPTSGMARLVASQLERDPRQPPTGNEKPSFQSGFEDEKLYIVRPYIPSRHDRSDLLVPTGEPCVLRVMRAADRQRSRLRG